MTKKIKKTDKMNDEKIRKKILELRELIPYLNYHNANYMIMVRKVTEVCPECYDKLVKTNIEKILDETEEQKNHLISTLYKFIDLVDELDAELKEGGESL